LTERTLNQYNLVVESFFKGGIMVVITQKEKSEREIRNEEMRADLNFFRRLSIDAAKKKQTLRKQNIKP